jgi:ATP synthase protein I
MTESGLSRKPRGQTGNEHLPLRAFGTVGMVGSLVTTPLVLFIFAGIWLDGKFPSHFSWTLTFIVIGIGVGCFIAWRWIDKARPR